MASVRIRRIGIETNAGSPEVTGAVERIQKRLNAGTRDVRPVVEHFARAFRKSIDFDFQVGGRAPFHWRANAETTKSAKGHGRVLEGAKGPRLRKAIRVVVVPAATQSSYDIDVTAPFPGEIHQQGVQHAWVIRPKNGQWLWFRVPERPGAFQSRRRNAVKARRAGSMKAIPSRPGTHLVRVKEVIHPGLPARKFVVIREGLLREHWRAPLRAFLFEGRMPA